MRADGNGTSDVFACDPSVLYISLHRYQPATFFPGTGAASEVGAGAGEGATVNIPWTETGLGWADYAAAFRHLVLPILSHFDPCLILVSAGFDAAAGDPLGGMSLTPPAFGALTEQLCALAGGRVVVALEGGYNEDAISACADAVLRALLRCGGDAGPDPLRAAQAGRLARERCRPGTAAALAAAREVQKRHWACLGEAAAEAAWAAFAAEEEGRARAPP